jgi:hypothetical protein
VGAQSQLKYPCAPRESALGRMAKARATSIPASPKGRFVMCEASSRRCSTHDVRESGAKFWRACAISTTSDLRAATPVHQSQSDSSRLRIRCVCLKPFGPVHSWKAATGMRQRRSSKAFRHIPVPSLSSRVLLIAGLNPARIPSALSAPRIGHHDSSSPRARYPSSGFRKAAATPGSFPTPPPRTRGIIEPT